MKPKNTKVKDQTRNFVGDKGSLHHQAKSGCLEI